MTNKQKGDRGEAQAAAYLKQKGYEILDRNFKTEVGEIDLVASDNGCIVFVEVKSRKNLNMGYPCEAVTKSKIKKICQVASQYLNKYRIFDADVRFDIIEIYDDAGQIEHIENAFDSPFDY